MINEYSLILDFIKEHNHISYNQFNEYVLKDIYLFNVPKDEYFLNIDNKLNKILKILPSIKRILSKPIIHLKDYENIVPVEAAKVINNQTLAHVARHTELWGDITSDGIKPRKLKTIEKIENYVIYENIVVARVINSILSFTKQTIQLMKDILYGCEDLHLNMLDRTHHKLYFLAIGKLHIEYASAHEKHYSLYLSCVEKIQVIEKTLRSKLGCSLYKLCNKNKSKIKLKKTNVFRNHKDYKLVFDIAKIFESEIEHENNEVINKEISREEYASYVNLLMIFALGHFNFEFNSKDKFDFFNLNTTCSFGKWNINISNINYNNIHALQLSFSKENKYNICIIYNDIKHISKTELEHFKENYKFDEYLYVNNLNYGKKDILYLSIYDVDSFRRLQQLILRGMIYCDHTHDICPFCGKKTKYHNGVYECDICRGQIYEKECEKTHKKYYVTSIKKFKSNINNNETIIEKRKFLHDRLHEAQMHYRNITPISIDGDVLCPDCGKVLKSFSK